MKCIRLMRLRIKLTCVGVSEPLFMLIRFFDIT